LSGRRVHPESGRIYHIVYNPPQQEGVDDETGEALIQREDDQETTIRKRLEVYHQQTEPLVNFYQHLGEQQGAPAPKYIRIEGVGEVDAIKQQLFAALS